MNKERRKSLKKMVDSLQSWQITVDDLLDTEKSCYDNLPESLVDSERGQEFEDNIDILERLQEAINDACEIAEELL